MSKTKFLGIPEGGKRAEWIEMEGGGSADVGGGGVLRVNVTAVDGDVTNLTADKTYAEIVSAFEAGSVITAYFVLGTGYVFTLSQRGETHFLFHSIFTVSGSPAPMFLQIQNDDNVMLIESAFS